MKNNSSHNKIDKEILKKMNECRMKGFVVPSVNLLKSDKDMEGIRKSAKINIAALDAVAKVIHAGMTTNEIDMLVYKVTSDMGGIPAPLGYEGFKKSCCTSINNEVCHGIPSDDIVLKDGDIINVDCSTIYKGYFSDSSRMFMIGNVSPERKKLVEITKEAVDKAVEAVKPWEHLGTIGAICNETAIANGYTVVREIGGHGCGVEFHEDPWVGFTTRRNTGMILVPGMCFTIEPMINAGKPEIEDDLFNGWTIYTKDNSDSAQWEVQVLVTPEGHEIISY